MTEKQKQKKRDYQGKYRVSEAGRATTKRYWSSDKGKAKLAEPERSYESRRDYHSDYRKGEARKTSLKAYNRGDKHRDCLTRYNQSDKGKSQPYKRYGITHKDFEAMITAQNGMCPIGPHKFGERGRRPDSPCVDHCHKTGKVRMVLCRTHNTMLGLCHESVGELQTAIEYLKKFEVEF